MAACEVKGVALIGETHREISPTVQVSAALINPPQQPAEGKTTNSDSRAGEESSTSSKGTDVLQE